MKTTIAVAALTILFCSAAHASGELCPDPPAGMVYGDSINEYSEASIKGKPFVKCVKSSDGNAMGEGYTYTTWACPTFTATDRRAGLTSQMKKIGDKYNIYPKYYEQWTVTDRNGAKWTIYHEALSSYGPKPVFTRTSAAVANGCKATITYEITAPGIDIMLRNHWTQPLKNKPVPAF